MFRAFRSFEALRFGAEVFGVFYRVLRIVCLFWVFSGLKVLGFRFRKCLGLRFRV